MHTTEARHHPDPDRLDPDPTGYELADHDDPGLDHDLDQVLDPDADPTGEDRPAAGPAAASGTETGRRVQAGEARRAAARVIGSWAAVRCPDATDEELEHLANEVARAVRRAVAPRMLPPGHNGLTSKPGADADAARRIAARLEAGLQPATVPLPRQTPRQMSGQMSGQVSGQTSQPVVGQAAGRVSDHVPGREPRQVTGPMYPLRRPLPPPSRLRRGGPTGGADDRR
jgi:hypothetical protein